jgi:hypothetical protein
MLMIRDSGAGVGGRPEESGIQVQAIPTTCAATPIAAASSCVVCKVTSREQPCSCQVRSMRSFGRWVRARRPLPTVTQWSGISSSTLVVIKRLVLIAPLDLALARRREMCRRFRSHYMHPPRGCSLPPKYDIGSIDAANRLHGEYSERLDCSERMPPDERQSEPCRYL